MKILELVEKENIIGNVTDPYHIRHVSHGSVGRFDIVDSDDDILMTEIYQNNNELKSSLIKTKKHLVSMLPKIKKSLSEEKHDDLSELPPGVINDLKSNISKGAKDIKQKWANALELVHKAYEVGYEEEEQTVDEKGKQKKIKSRKPVERPTPSMEAGWKQYEELLQHAVGELAKHRGLSGKYADWRMSSIDTPLD